MIFQYRHLPRSISSSTRSVMKAHNISDKRYRAIRWDNFSSNRLYINQYIQYRDSPRSILDRTISVLKEHKTWHKHYRTTEWDKLPFDRLYSPWYFNTGTHHSLSWVELYRCWRGTTSGTSITEQHGETRSLSIDCICTIIVQYRHLPR
jgi:hypothetical protein